MQKLFKTAVKVFFGILAAILLFLAFAIAPVDRTLPQDQPFYEAMFGQIDSVMRKQESSVSDSIRVGFAKVSITPHYPTATAGYVKRKGARITSIRDSVFVRTMIIQQERKSIAVVSLDMLIVPPILYNRLVDALPDIHYTIDQVYLGTTHTHNSFGQWDDHLVGETFAGKFDPELIEFVTSQILTSIQNAAQDSQPADILYGSVEVREAVTNRLIKDGEVDPLLHMVEVHRKDGTKGVFTSFSAHATCMSSRDLRLSRDYPGQWVDTLEANGYDFAMFMAGAVGSHAPIAMENGDEKIETMATLLTTAVQHVELKKVEATALRFHRIPLLLGKQQIKVLPDWRVREWLSLPLMGKYTPSLTMLQMGNMIMLGTPCDFSGMLTRPIYSTASRFDKHAFVTSFNGSYIGYITPDDYYDLEKYETQTMNWYGPGNGAYVQKCLNHMIERSTE
jgi:neutral ceramidase